MQTPGITSPAKALHPASMAAGAFYVCAVVLALWLLPGAPFVPSLLAFILIAAGACLCLRRSAGYSPRAEVVLLLAATLLTVGIIANVYTFTTLLHGTDSDPVLINNDARRNFNDAIFFLGLGDGRSQPSHGLFSFVLTGIMAITGPSITALSCLSMVSTLCTLICISSIWVNLTGNRSHSWIPMAAAAAVCYFIAAGTVLVKDAFVIAAFALAALALTRIEFSWRSFVRLTVAAIMVMLARPNMLFAMTAGIPLMWWTQRTNARSMAAAAAMLAIVAAAYVMPSILSLTPKLGLIMDVSENNAVSFTYARHTVYTSLIGDYHNLSHLQRLLLMPFSAAVQFFIPFPWNYLRDIDFGLSQIYAHVGYPWYAFGGLCIYYLCFAWRRSPALMRALFLWGVFIWLIPCWCFGGTISRYGLMALPMFAPAVAFTLRNSLRRRSLHIFATGFIIIVTITLLVCHHLQSSIQP